MTAYRIDTAHTNRQGTFGTLYDVDGLVIYCEAKYSREAERLLASHAVIQASTDFAGNVVAVRADDDPEARDAYEAETAAQFADSGDAYTDLNQGYGI